MFDWFDDTSNIRQISIIVSASHVRGVALVWMVLTHILATAKLVTLDTTVKLVCF